MNHREAVESLAMSLDQTKWCIFKEPVLSHRNDGIPDVSKVFIKESEG